MEGVGVGRAPAGAVEPRPAGGALLLVQHVGGGELPAEALVDFARQDAAHGVALAPDELVAGEDLAVRGDGHVLHARAAAGEALLDAGAAV